MLFWAPVEDGTPSSGGREVAVYDTLDHQISGFSQQQSGDASLTFTSQHGLVRVSDLPRVGVPGRGTTAPSESAAAAPMPAPVPVEARPSTAKPIAPAPPAAVPAAATAASTDDEIFSRIERLAELRQKGILTEEEFATKKTELLARL